MEPSELRRTIDITTELGHYDSLQKWFWLIYDSHAGLGAL